MRGVGFPGCGLGVTLPISTSPKPMSERPCSASACLSKRPRGRRGCRSSPRRSSPAKPAAGPRPWRQPQPREDHGDLVRALRVQQPHQRHRAEVADQPVPRGLPDLILHRSPLPPPQHRHEPCRVAEGPAVGVPAVPGGRCTCTAAAGCALASALARRRPLEAVLRAGAPAASAAPARPPSDALLSTSRMAPKIKIKDRIFRA